MKGWVHHDAGFWNGVWAIACIELLLEICSDGNFYELTTAESVPRCKLTDEGLDFASPRSAREINLYIR